LFFELFWFLVVQCIETGVVYLSQREAIRLTGFTNIHAACTGAQIHAGGYHWRFVTGEDVETIPGHYEKEVAL
jgi:hypothetical protein